MHEIDEPPTPSSLRPASLPPSSQPALRAAVRPGALAAAGAAVFAALLVAVERGNGLASLDPQVTHRVVGLRTPTLDDVAQVVTLFGSEAWLAVLTLAAVGVLLLRAERRRALVVIASMATSAAATVAVKFVVNRPRPGALVELGAPEASFSFPSGHTLNSTVCYGVLALTALSLLRTLRARILTASAAGVVVVSIGLSRLYLGYHWATDVLAGWALGLSILALAVTVTTILSRPRSTLPAIR